MELLYGALPIGAIIKRGNAMDAGAALIERCKQLEGRIKELVKHVNELIERNAELEKENELLKKGKWPKRFNKFYGYECAVCGINLDLRDLFTFPRDERVLCEECFDKERGKQ